MAHILVVDDSPTDQFAIRSILERAGHQISTASTVDEGLELARALQPALITMDIVFEGQRGTSGFMGVRKIKRDPECGDIPVIIMSSKNQPSDKAWGMRQGADNYLVKPPQEHDLLAAVNELLPPEQSSSDQVPAEPVSESAAEQPYFSEQPTESSTEQPYSPEQPIEQTVEEPGDGKADQSDESPRWGSDR